ncbi:MAG TPA: hypothetical protein VLF90_02150 [Patescibacteria group bacterium]|nr:hypothetical protein [Patescibacteria group bacterium]
MSPKNPNINQEPQQGFLFKDVRPGTTEPDQIANQTQHFELTPEGEFPEAIEPTIPETDPATHSAVVTNRRHRAQLGKHSPLERDGNYSNVKVGDVLPGFGPVTHTNRSAAEQYAHKLDSERSNKK